MIPPERALCFNCFNVGILFLRKKNYEKFLAEAEFSGEFLTENSGKNSLGKKFAGENFFSLKFAGEKISLRKKNSAGKTFFR